MSFLFNAVQVVSSYGIAYPVLFQRKVLFWLAGGVEFVAHHRFIHRAILLTIMRHGPTRGLRIVVKLQSGSFDNN